MTETSATMSGEPHSILVVDDDVDTCQNLSDILAEFGHEVDTAHDGPSALEKIRRKHYDVALLDMNMPGMSGLELHREIRNLGAGTVAMIVTAYATMETEREALGAGMWRVLSKPVDLDELLPLVERAVRQPLVLVVDDDCELCQSLWDVFHDRGYRVALAHNERNAGRHLGGTEFQVVLIDMKLPDGDGREVLDRVRRLNPQARTVLITGHRSDTEGAVRQALREGADAVCYKPFDVPRLLETVDRLARREPSG
jgi:CheY-like chemotaxis protein